MTELTEDSILEAVGISLGKPRVIDFYSKTCAPCKMTMPFLLKAEEKYKDVLFYKCDVETLKAETINALGIVSVPTIFYINEKNVVESTIGAKGLIAIIDSIENYCLK